MSQKQDQLARTLAALDGPGVVFNELLRESGRTVIGVSAVISRRGGSITRPKAVIIVTPRHVKVERLGGSPRQFLLWGIGASALLGSLAVLFFPPWRPGESLLGDVSRLLRAIRGLSE